MWLTFGIMTPRDSPTDRWLAKGRWGYLLRIAGLFTLLMTALRLVTLSFANFGWNSAAWDWIIPDPQPITPTVVLEHATQSALGGLLFGLLMWYRLRQRVKSASVV